MYDHHLHTRRLYYAKLALSRVRRPGACLSVSMFRTLMTEINYLSQPIADKPIPMILTCPACNNRHIDQGEFATKPHHTHACQHCGIVWRPAIKPTVGVQFLPGFKNEKEDP